MDFTGKNIVITGASSGIGLASARLLAQKGGNVYALSRRARTGERTNCGRGRIIEVGCDVTDSRSVREAFEYIFSDAENIYGLVNCAGTGIAGAVEETSEEELSGQLDCNLYGPLRALREALGRMRKQGEGRVVNMSSVGGLIGLPFQGMYSASKFALEGMTEALRNELRPFGIRVCLIEPGDVRTGFTRSRRYTARTRESEVYRRELCSAVNAMSVSEEKGMPPEKVARLVLRALSMKNPPVRMAAGGGYKALCFIKRFLPDRLVSWVVFKMYCTRKSLGSEYWDFEKDVLGVKKG